VNRLKRDREIEALHLFHKTGDDAGQSVPHWHLHLVILTESTQSFWGRFAILQNMLIGSSPLTGVALQEAVTKYSQELM